MPDRTVSKNIISILTRWDILSNCISSFENLALIESGSQVEKVLEKSFSDTIDDLLYIIDQYLKLHSKIDKILPSQDIESSYSIIREIRSLFTEIANTYTNDTNYEATKSINLYSRIVALTLKYKGTIIYLLEEELLRNLGEAYKNYLLQEIPFDLIEQLDSARQAVLECENS